MSGFCCPPQEQDPCAEELLKAAAKLGELQAQIDELKALLELNKAQVSPDLWKEYLKIISAATRNTDMNVTHAASSAYESLKLFNENYKLLKDAFDNFYAFMKRFGVDLTYTFKEINSPYTIIDTDMKANIIFRVNSGGSIELGPLNKNYKGKIIHIRNNTDNMIHVTTASGVTVTPEDVLYLRRRGSTLGLINLGGDNWDSYGELP